MSDRIKDLSEKRMQAVQAARAAAEEAAQEGLTNEQIATADQKYNRANADIDRYEDLINRERRNEEFDREEEKRTAEQEAAAKAALERRGSGGGRRDLSGRAKVDKEFSEELRSVVSGDKQGFELKLSDVRHTLALSGRYGREAEERAEVFFNVGGSASAAAGEGQEINPGTFVRELYRALVATNPIFESGIRIITTERNEVLTLPKKVRSVKASSPAANRTTVVSQEAATIAKTKGSFTTETLGAIKYAQIIQASREFADFTVFDGESLMAEDLGDVLGSVTALDLTLGTAGAQSPGGIVTQTTLNYAPTGSVALGGISKHDDIIELIYGIGEKYARNAKFMMNRAIVKKVRLIKDPANHFIYDAVKDPAQPDSILGYPVLTNPDMATAATNGTIQAIFADFSKYYARVVGTMRVERSNDVYFENDLVGIKGVMYLDGKLFDTGASIKFTSTT